ncbi:MAG: hypothetical protein WD038_11055 [Balneolales bacterium]
MIDINKLSRSARHPPLQDAPTSRKPFTYYRLIKSRLLVYSGMVGLTHRRDARFCVSTGCTRITKTPLRKASTLSELAPGNLVYQHILWLPTAVVHQTAAYFSCRCGFPYPYRALFFWGTRITETIHILPIDKIMFAGLFRHGWFNPP